MRALFLTALLLASAPAGAHELRSAKLRLVEMPAGIVQASLKAPLSRDGTPVSVVPHLIGTECTPVTEPTVERGNDWVLRRWQMRCANGLDGQSLRLEGLDPGTPDAVVIVQLADGRQSTGVVDRHDPEILLKAQPGSGAVPVLPAYLSIGIEHILIGADHLVFVLSLMLVVFASRRSLGMLLAAITAFTVAHSLTLALAVLGVWGLPRDAVELLIALSIVLLAYELATQAQRSGRGLAPSLSLRNPWVVAAAFGLLHGFGFAGALAEVGLPGEARIWALALFNLGVEIGQLGFVGAVLLAFQALRRVNRSAVPVWAWPAAVNALGGVAMYWTLDRVLQWSSPLWSGA